MKPHELLCNRLAKLRVVQSCIDRFNRFQAVAVELFNASEPTLQESGEEGMKLEGEQERN